MIKSRIPLENFVKEYSVRNKLNEDIPVYSVTNSQGFCTEYFSKEVASQDKTTYKIVPRGYFAYNPSRINVGSVDWQKYEDRVIVSPLYNVFSVSDEIDCQYLYYFFRSNIGRQMIKAKSSGSVRDNLKIEMLKEMTIPDISMREQQFCSSVLDKLQILIKLKCDEIKQMDELVKARFIEVFGESDKNTKQFPVRKLNEISSYWNGLTYKPVDTVEDGNGTLVLRSSNIQNGVLAFDDNVYVSCDIKEKLLVQDNDILMCSRNGSAALVGKTALIKGLVEPTTFGAFMMIIRSEYYSYLKTYFEMPFFRSQISTGTSTINQITGKMLNEISLPVPDIGTVKVFEEFVNRIAKSKAVIEKSLKELETLQASLMQKYFS